MLVRCAISMGLISMSACVVDNGDDASRPVSDCRNDGLGCTSPFECLEGAERGFACRLGEPDDEDEEARRRIQATGGAEDTAPMPNSDSDDDDDADQFMGGTGGNGDMGGSVSEEDGAVSGGSETNSTGAAGGNFGMASSGMMSTGMRDENPCFWCLETAPYFMRCGENEVIDAGDRRLCQVGSQAVPCTTMEACCTAQEDELAATACMPTAGLSIELMWDTPNDQNQTDMNGTDVDLHLRHPNSRSWMWDDPLDCYFASPNPDWGEARDLSDNPRLEIDDTNGRGPELIVLDRPQNTSSFAGGVNGTPYTVGVHYYRATLSLFDGMDAWVTSTATVRILVDGEVIYEASQVLNGTNELWEVAQIFWEDGVATVVRRDVMSQLVPRNL